MVSRRVFLKNGAFAFVSLGFAPSFLSRTALAATGRSKQLIAIFQRGAVDGLSMVVPFGEADYYRARPGIAIPRPNGENGALDLDGFFGFRENGGKLEINETEAAIRLAIGHIAHLRVVVPDSVLLKLGEKLAQTFRIEVFYAGSAAGGHDLKFLRVSFDQGGHKWTATRLQVTENAHLVGKSFLGFWASKSFVNPPIVADAHGGAESVFDLLHSEGRCGSSGKEQARRSALIRTFSGHP